MAIQCQNNFLQIIHFYCNSLMEISLQELSLIGAAAPKSQTSSSGIQLTTRDFSNAARTCSKTKSSEELIVQDTYTQISG